MYQNDARGDIIKEFIREYQAHGVGVGVDCHTYARSKQIKSRRQAAKREQTI
nr:hypothetical protein [uncultured Campylobacter sp.]